MAGFCGLPSGCAALSAEDEALREGGFGLDGIADVAGAGSGFVLGVETPDGAADEFIEASDRVASFVENIRVSRFVIDVFSDGVGVGAGVGCFCGSDGGAACPFAATLLLMPF